MSDARTSTPESQVFRLSHARGDFTDLLISDELRGRLARERAQIRSRDQPAYRPPRQRSLPAWVQVTFAILIAGSLWLLAFGVIYISVRR